MSYYIIIRGPLGSGKSTLSRRLGEILDAKLFAMDPILDEHELTKDKEDGYISQRSFLKANEIILPEVKQCLKENRPVIFEGNFYWKSQIDDLIEKLDTPHVVFTLKVPLEVCIWRDQERERTYGVGAATVVYEKTMQFVYGKEIDGTRTMDKCIAEMISLLPSASNK